MISAEILAACLLVGFLWGSTNPFMKRGAQASSLSGSWLERLPVPRSALELVLPLTQLSYLVPLLVNQSGSLVYYLTLGNADISVVGPLANSFTFVFTALCGRLLGEPQLHWQGYLGICSVLIGVAIIQLSSH